MFEQAGDVTRDATVGILEEIQVGEVITDIGPGLIVEQ